MIRVKLEPEPPSFAVNVRQPGAAFLRTTPRPTSAQFKRNNFWKAALGDMKKSYSSICAFTSMWMGAEASIDHFIPKSINPSQAYEWSNFRLSMPRINSLKGKRTDILDPFTIQSEWFELDLASLIVRPSASLKSNIQDKVQNTIDALKLNDDDWLQLRYQVLNDFLAQETSLSYLRKYYPFIASEVARQTT